MMRSRVPASLRWSRPSATALGTSGSLSQMVRRARAGVWPPSSYGGYPVASV